jgi:LacI family transcriptional regulator
VADRSTIYEVAGRSGVSIAMVSRVMADGKGFSAATRDRSCRGGHPGPGHAAAATRHRVMAAAAELGRVPSWPARSLASRHAGIVGLLIPERGTGRFYIDLPRPGIARNRLSAGRGTDRNALHR